MDPASAPLTELLQSASRGEPGALDQVFAALYPELRKIAHARLRTDGGQPDPHTTALVHESFLRLVKAERLALTDRKHFFAYAAKTLRSIIVDAAREHLAARRGGDKETLHLSTTLADTVASAGGGAVLVQIHDALTSLEQIDPELIRTVEMRFFAGYTEPEIAEIEGCSERTVRRRWEKARAYLLVNLQDVADTD
jgi:RNA polymerase sigma factor (TIGR02999 family)